MKKCTKCLIDKDESEFAFRNKSKGILHSSCKSCKRVSDKVHYTDNEDRKLKIRETNKKLIDKCKQYIIDLKKNSCCSICGDKRWYVLDFHHLSNKLSNIADASYKGWSIKKLQEEIDKCIIVCSNCHREIHYKED